LVNKNTIRGICVVDYVHMGRGFWQEAKNFSPRRFLKSAGKPGLISPETANSAPGSILHRKSAQNTTCFTFFLGTSR